MRELVRELPLKDLYWGAAACCLILALLAIFGRRHQRLPAALAASDARTVVRAGEGTPANTTAPEAARPTVHRVGDEHWIVRLPASDSWFDSGIPLGAGFEVWIEPEPPATDCQFLMLLKHRIYSSELLVEANSPSTQRILRAFPWVETSLADLPWVDTVRLRLSDSCRKGVLTLNVEASFQIPPDDPLYTLEEYAEHREKVQVGRALAGQLQRLFRPSLAEE